MIHLNVHIHLKYFLKKYIVTCLNTYILSSFLGIYMYIILHNLSLSSLTPKTIVILEV